jgi:hypothetical protein
MADLSHDTYKRLAAVTLAGRPLPAVLDELVEICQDAVEAADAISITLVHDRRGATAAHSRPLARDLDELQYALGHGPCLDAGRSGTFLEIPDMSADPRWPDYAPRAAAAGRGA